MIKRDCGVEYAKELIYKLARTKKRSAALLVEIADRLEIKD